MEINIRPMKPDDAAEVARLADELSYPSSASQMLGRIPDVGRRDDGLLLVAEGGNHELAGWVHVRGQHLLESEPYAQLAGLVVDARGRRGGIGRRLMIAAEAWAKRAGYPMMRINTNNVRVGAKPLYEALGYELLKTQYAFSKKLA